MRVDGRKNDELRPVTITTDYVIYPEGSALIQAGNTHVLCNVTVESIVPRWMQNQGVPGGWVTAEYAMLPRSTETRSPRETRGLRGRSQEIRRLIGRSLRAAVDLEKLGPRTCIVDCDVIQADGGTRTAAITGGYVALRLALQELIEQGQIPADTIQESIAAVSVGLVGGRALLDLCYDEDSAAEVDVNVVMNGKGEYVEVQGTAEGALFSRSAFEELLNLASKGIDELLEIQNTVLNAR
jgi:ribonuclease PH